MEPKAAEPEVVDKEAGQGVLRLPDLLAAVGKEVVEGVRRLQDLPVAAGCKEAAQFAGRGPAKEVAIKADSHNLLSAEGGCRINGLSISQVFPLRVRARLRRQGGDVQ